MLAVGHGIVSETKEELLDVMRVFTEPQDVKEQISIANSSCHQGYVGIGTEALEGALADDDQFDVPRLGDLKETIDSGTEHGPQHPEVLAGTPLHGPNQLRSPRFRQHGSAISMRQPKRAFSSGAGSSSRLSLDVV